MLALVAAGAAKAERKQQAEDYAVRAVSFLNAAHKAGFFAAAANLQRLRTDMELQFLRDRADFKKLASELEPTK